jgi:hypothetical protein
VTLDAVTNPTLTTNVTVDTTAGATPDDTKVLTLTVLPINVSTNSAIVYQPNAPLLLSASVINAADKNTNPITITFTSLTNAQLMRVSTGTAVALNTGVLMSALRRGEYYILPSGTAGWTISASSSRGTVTGHVGTITNTSGGTDITTVAGSGVTSYATAEAFFTAALPSGYTDGASYYYSGADGYARATATAGYYGDEWGQSYFSPISTSAPSGVSTALQNAASATGQYIFKESTRWRFYTLGGYSGSRTWTEQTTA